VLDSPIYLSTPRTITREWTVRGETGEPIAHHSVEIASALLASSWPLWSACGLTWLRVVTANRGLECSSETWPTLIRPHSRIGRALGSGTLDAGLLLVQRASEPGGRAVAVATTTMRARCASRSLLELFSISRGSQVPGAEDESASRDPASWS
jgi:hypothetical protein